MSARNAIIFKTQNWLWSAILKFSQQCFRDSWIVIYCWFNSYYTFITKEILVLELSKESPTWLFSCDYCEIFKKTYFEERLWTDASVLLTHVRPMLDS